MTLDELVKEALRNAKENGEDFNDWTDEQIALDMLSYDADIEKFPYEDVIASVKKCR